MMGSIMVFSMMMMMEVSLVLVMKSMFMLFRNSRVLCRVIEMLVLIRVWMSVVLVVRCERILLVLVVLKNLGFCVIMWV